MFKGREIRRLLLVSALCCVLLILSLSLYMIFSSRSNLREQTDNMKTALAVNIGEQLQRNFVAMNESLMANEGMNLGSGIADLLANKKSLYNLFAYSIQAFNDAEFAAYYNGDMLLASSTKPGVEIPGPDVVPAGGQEYEVLDNLDGREGTFFLFEKESLLPGDRIVYAIDNTSQIEAMQTAYEDTKSGMVTEQIIVVSIIFLVLLAGSLLLIGYLVMKWIGKPMDRLNQEARSILAGQPVAEQEVQKGSLFANLQALINSGRAIFAGSGGKALVGSQDGKPESSREVKKVMALWAVVITAMFLLSTVAILVFSISVMNSKSDAIVGQVSEEMAAYYNGAYDSLTKSSLGGSDAYIGRAVFDPDADIDRDMAMQGLATTMKSCFNGAAVVLYLEKDGEGTYVSSVNDGLTLDYWPEEMGEPYAVMHDFFSPGDTVLVGMNETGYATYGDGQFAYYAIDLTPQVGVLEGLYQDASGSLLTVQLILLFAFLALAIVVSSFTMAWGVRKYITRPILELDAMSNRIIEGDLDFEITPDESSGFAVIQRLLKKAQELLQSMGEEQLSY